MKLTAVIPENLRNITEDIIDVHLKHIGNEYAYNFPRIWKTATTGDAINILKRFNAEYGLGLVEKLIEGGTVRIVNNFKNTSRSVSPAYLKCMIYDFLQKIFEQTNQTDKQLCLHLIIELYFENIHEKFPDLSKEVFEKIVKSYIPFLKLETLIENIRKEIIVPKSVVSEAFECILFPSVLREDCYQVIFNKIESCNYDFIGFELKCFEDALGFVGEHRQLKITIKHDNMERDFIFFAKFITTWTKICHAMSVKASKKEDFVYTKLVPLLEKIGVKGLLDIIPKCYFSRVQDVLVLEDLNPLGFTASDLAVPMQYDWMVMTVKSLSKFHAFSFILDQYLTSNSGRKTVVGDVFEEYLEEINMDKNNPICCFMHLGGKLISEYFIDKFSDICVKLSKDEFKRIADIEVGKTFDHQKRSSKFYNVICHGDLWGSNILLNSTKDCVFVDYQMLRYCPPTVDLIFLLYVNTEKEFRTKYMKEMFNIYYDNLKHNLSLYQIDIEQFYTEEIYFESLEYFKSTGIVTALLYNQMMLIPFEITKEFLGDEAKANKFYFEDRKDTFDISWTYAPFRTRIQALIEDLYAVCEKQ